MMKIRKFNESNSLTDEDIINLFSYAGDLSSKFEFERVGTSYVLWFNHEFYGWSSKYEDFNKYVDLLNEVRDVSEKIRSLYNSEIEFEEQSNAKLTMIISLNS